MDLCNEQNCCGCGMCEKKCPKQAIEIKENENGFWYPYIDKKKCIECGICKKQCKFQQLQINNQEMQKTIMCYAAQNENRSEEKRSASGGVFFAIAKNFIENGGWVCGAIMEIKNNKTRVYHIISNQLEDIKKMQGSKYIQSDIREIIEKIKNKISQNNKVLFCGTPCQNSAIKGIIGNNQNLFLMDIICHGVPSQKMFNDYLNTTFGKKDILCEFVFRDKTFKGKFVIRKVLINRGKKKIVYRPAHLESYYNLFLRSLIYRDCCYNCPFASEKRITDITIGDYWGIEKLHKEISAEKNNKAWSCVLVNTKQGMELIDRYAKNIKLIETNFENIKNGNGQLNKPSECDQNIRKAIFTKYRKNGYKEIDKMYKKEIGILKYKMLSIRYKFLKY